MEGSYGALKVTMDGRVAVVTIDNPPFNLVNGPLIVGLAEFLDAMATQDAVHVAVFRSADPDFFLMHGDVESIMKIPVHDYVPATEPNMAAATFLRLSKAPFVSIGMINGAARGGGAEFLMSLDFRIGSPRVVVGQPEVPMGILPGAGGTSRLPRLVGRSRALDLILTGRDVDASEALAIGWLTELVAPADLEARTMALAHRIAAMPAPSVASVKRVVDISLEGLEEALTAETDEFGLLTAPGIHVALMQKFLDAGGQTRDGEVHHMSSAVDAMLER